MDSINDGVTIKFTKQIKKRIHVYVIEYKLSFSNELFLNQVLIDAFSVLSIHSLVQSRIKHPEIYALQDLKSKLSAIKEDLKDPTKTVIPRIFSSWGDPRF